ncbi:internal scaffolding protein [Microviridae sp.]|nr:internal scaffolding protein [Microviridae sp.]
MRKYAITFDPKESITKQSFKDECDINKIMAKFQKTGAMTHFAKHAPQYGDATPCEYQDALNVVANANTMFEELPATIRDKFENDPKQFLDFVQDEKNADEMVELGLKSAPAVTDQLVTHSETIDPVSAEAENPGEDSTA